MFETYLLGKAGVSRTVSPTQLPVGLPAFLFFFLVFYLRLNTPSGALLPFVEGGSLSKASKNEGPLSPWPLAVRSHSCKGLA